MRLKSIGHQNANAAGAILEHTVMSLKRWGFDSMSYQHWESIGRVPGRVILTRVPLTTPYGTQGHTEFGLVIVAGTVAYRIEAKWQAVAGSVDEKFPYMVESLLMCPELKIILLYGGSHLEQSSRGRAAINFVRTRFQEAVLNKRKNFAEVFTPSEFTSWAQNEFRPRHEQNP